MTKLFDNLEKFKDRTALIDSDDIEYSYKDILEESDNIGSQIEKKSLVSLYVIMILII